MNAWLKLDPQRLEKHEKRASSKDEVHIEVRMSPYDIPDAMRGDYDHGLDRFVIEFRYIGDEPWQHLDVAEHVVARVGKHSGRIYGLEVNVKALKAKSVGFALLPAISAGMDRLVSKSANKGIMSDRYEVAKRAIQEAEGLLLGVPGFPSTKAAAK